MVRKTFTFEGKVYDVKAKDEIELALKVDKKKRELESGSVIIDRAITVRKWSEKWLLAYKEKSIDKVTYTGYRSRLNSIILPAIGNLKVKDVRPLHIQSVVNGMDGMSKEYINKVIYTMKQMFDAAKHNKMILDNPVAGIEKPKAKDGTHRAITNIERKYLLIAANKLGHPYGTWVKIMLFTGLRPSEAAVLQGRCVDFSTNTITVDSALKSITNEIGTPKNKSSYRKVPIPNILLEDLLKLDMPPLDFIMQNRSGRHLTNSNLGSMWKAIKRQMCIDMGCTVYRNQVIPINQKMVARGAPPIYPVADDLVPYCLRHTYCTDLQDAGVPINVAKELMGHSDINITAKIYTHSSETSFDAAIESINKFMDVDKEDLDCTMEKRSLSIAK